MSAWTTCPHCRLSHSVRPDGCCPRCRQPSGQVPSAGQPPAAAPPPAAPRPAATARPSGALQTSAPAASVSLSSPKPKPSALATAGGLGGAAIGVGMSRLFGAALLVPGVLGIVAAVVLVKLGPARARPFVLAVGALVGHVGWMAAGAAFTGAYAAVAPDVVLMAGGVAWLVLRPGLAPVIALAVLEIVSIAANGWQLASPVASADRKALVLHLLLRALVLAGLALGYRQHRKDARAASTAKLARTFE